MSALQKGFSHREDAKDTTIFKDEVQDLKYFSNPFDFSSCIINFFALSPAPRSGREPAGARRPNHRGGVVPLR
jgi:hypothetical protein